MTGKYVLAYQCNLSFLHRNDPLAPLPNLERNIIDIISQVDIFGEKDGNGDNDKNNSMNISPMDALEKLFSTEPAICTWFKLHC